MNTVFTEHKALVESGRFADAMRLSGENLARAETTLKAAVHASVEDKRTAARDFLDAGTLHLADLHYADMLKEEAATSLMIAATLIIGRINPETIASDYVGWLQKTVLRLGDALQQNGVEQLMNHFAMLLKLTVVTCDDYAGRFKIDADVLRTGKALKDYLETSGVADTLYTGKPIVPQNAIDIILNTLNVMSATGWCPME